MASRSRKLSLTGVMTVSAIPCANKLSGLLVPAESIRNEVARPTGVSQQVRQGLDSIAVVPFCAAMTEIVDTNMIRNRESIAIGLRRPAPVFDVTRERALVIIQVNRVDSLPALEQPDGKVHRERGFAAATFLVAKQNHMRPGVCKHDLISCVAVSR